MKVALIVSPYPLEEFPSPPLGLSYAAAAFEAAGAEVRVLDYMVRRFTPDKLRGELESFQPDIVGTNSVTLNFHDAAAILQTAKRCFPSAVTVMGGPHVSFDFHNSLIQYPEIDIIAVSEGEKTIQELVSVIKDRLKWHSVKGIAYKKNGNPVYTGSRKFIQDLDALPTPAWHLVPLSRYLALGFPISIITSRGCPNKCIFCQGRHMVGAKVRYRSIPSIIDEIELLLNYGFHHINIADNFFTFDSDRVNTFCAEIKTRNLAFRWSAFARADSVNKELIATMKDAGCDSLLFGIESGNQEILNRIRKRITLDQIRKAVADCKAVGMNVFGSFIAGLPGESMETLMETHRFATDLDIDYGYHFLAPFPGTTVKEEIDRYDLELLMNDWSRFDANRARACTSHLSADEIEGFVYDYYSREVEAEEKRIAQRFKEKRSSDIDLSFYMGKQKNQIIFQLFSEDIIEEHCYFPVDSTHSDPQIRLVEKIVEITDKEISIVEPVIKEIVESGYLKLEKNNGKNTWYWTHNNRIDHPTN